LSWHGASVQLWQTTQRRFRIGRTCFSKETDPAAALVSPEDHLVSDRDVPDILAHRPHDAGAVAAARVEVLRLALPLTLGDDVERGAERCPDIVVVDARRHHVDEHLVRADARRGDHLTLPRVTGLAEAALTDDVGMHP